MFQLNVYIPALEARGVLCSSRRDWLITVLPVEVFGAF